LTRGWTDADVEFSVDEDDCVVVERTSPKTENLRLAVEVFIDPFGLRARTVDTYIGEWRRSFAEFGADYSLASSSAGVQRVDEHTIRFVALYSQFEDCLMNVTEFETMLPGLADYLRARE
jgi:hypothetical protein